MQTIMLKYYLYFLFLISHLPLISIPSCHLSFNQKENQGYSYQPNFLYADQYKHLHNLYDATGSLLTYSVLDLKNYFNYHYYSDEDILACSVLYMSDDFVQLAKACPGYNHAIKNLYSKLKRMGSLCKLNNIVHGSYCVGLFKRVRHLCKEMEIAKKFVNKKTEQFADAYNINLTELFPVSGSISAQCIYQSYINILDEASLISRQNTIIRDCIGQASSIGLEANKSGYTKQASALANFCWTVIDLTKAFGEGICLGAVQTIDSITHPVQTIKNGLIGIGIITYELGVLTATAAESIFLYAVDSDRYCVRQEVIVAQVDKIIEDTGRYLRATPTREMVKQGSAFITEGILFTKVCTFAHTIAKRLRPLAKHYVEYVATKEPVACLAEGAIYVENIIEHVIPGRILQNLKEGLVNQNLTAILRNGYYEVNGFKFTEFYYDRLWNNGRKSPGLRAESILRGATRITPDARGYPGFYRYMYEGWEMIFNPKTRVVSHLCKIKKQSSKVL